MQGMIDINEIRHRNVRALVRQLESGRGGARAGGLAMLAEKMGKSSAQVSHFAAERPTKNIGDKIAREIEVAFGLEYAWMDWHNWEPEASTPSHSQSLRLDPEMMAELATVLAERWKGMPGGFDLRNEDHAAHFVHCYGLYINMTERPIPENVVRFSSALTTPQGARKNDRSEDVPATGTVKSRDRRGTRRKA